MKHTITLTTETIEKLYTLIDEIDYNESKDDCDTDVVIENLYKILDEISPIIRELVE